MKYFVLLLTFLTVVASNVVAQNAACDGTRFKGPVFSQVKKTTVDYAPAPNFAELPPSAGDTVILKMDVYEPVGDVAVARPVVILAHGGSFIFGDKVDMKADCERFAKAGYVAVSIQYRLYPLLVLGFPDSTDIVGTVIKAIGSMKAAVRYFRQDAATVNLFKADTAHIFLGGYSAGAVCALHTGFLSETDALTPFVQNALDLNGGFEGDAGTVETAPIPPASVVFITGRADCITTSGSTKVMCRWSVSTVPPTMWYFMKADWLRESPTWKAPVNCIPGHSKWVSAVIWKR